MTQELERAIAKFMQSYIGMQEEIGDLKEAAECSEKVITKDKEWIKKQSNDINRLEHEKGLLHHALNDANDLITQLQSKLNDLREKLNTKPLKWGDPAKWENGRRYIEFTEGEPAEIRAHLEPYANSKILYLDDILALVDDSEVTQ